MHTEFTAQDSGKWLMWFECWKRGVRMVAEDGGLYENEAAMLEQEPAFRSHVLRSFTEYGFNPLEHGRFIHAKVD